MSFISVLKADLVFFKSKFYSSENIDVSVLDILKYLFHPCFAVVFWYRVYYLLCKSRSSLLRKIGIFLYLRTSRKYSVDIHPRARIGVPFRLGHHFGIVIGPNVVIGKNVYIFNDVTLGNKNVGLAENAMPEIFDRVIIGTGSKLLGGIVIKSNSIIGANSTVVTNIDEGEVWIGSPAKFLKKNIY